VFHFHLHVVPRYPDATKDRLEVPWQPGATGDPERIADLGNRLASHL
jgi:histidine triad (HIT) family protein